MLHLPVVVFLLIIVILLAVFRAARLWVILIVLALGLYAANTQVGKDARQGGNTVVNTVNQHTAGSK